MKAKTAKTILETYADDDEVAFAVYDSLDACMILTNAITPEQRNEALAIIQMELDRCVDDDLCQEIREVIG